MHRRFTTFFLYALVALFLISVAWTAAYVLAQHTDNVEWLGGQWLGNRVPVLTRAFMGRDHHRKDACERTSSWDCARMGWSYGDASQQLEGRSGGEGAKKRSRWGTDVQ